MAGAKQLILDIIAKDKTKQGLTSASKNVSGMSKAVRGVATGIAAIGLAKFAKDSVDTFQNATKETLALNRATGGTVEATSRLRFAAKQSGQDIGQFTKSMGLLDKNLVKAAQTGKGPVADTMRKLGVQFTDASGKVKPLTELLPQMAGAFQKMPDGPTKTAMALQLFGKQGAALLPFLNKGQAGIQELMAKTDEYNQVIGTEQVDAFKKNLEAQRKFDAAMDGIKMQLGEHLLPAITPIVEKLGDLAKAFGNLPEGAQTGIVAIAGLAVAFNFLSGPLGMVKSGLTGLAGLFTSTGTAAASAATGAESAGAAAATGAAGMGTAAASATLLGGALTAVGSAFNTYAIADQFGTLAGVFGSFANMAGGPLNILSLVMARGNDDAQHLADGMRAVTQSLGDMSASGNIEGITAKWALMEKDMTPDQLLAVANSIPGFNQKLNEAGLRIDAVSGKITAMPKAQIDAVIAPLEAKLKVAQQRLNTLKQAKKPDVDAINKAAATVKTIQGQINGIRQRTKPNIGVEAGAARREIAGIGVALGNLPRTVPVTIKVSKVGAAIGVGAAATGGERAGLTYVGERGPELVALPEGATVYTASQSRLMFAPEHLAKGKVARKRKGKTPAQKLAEKRAKIQAKIDALNARKQAAVDRRDAQQSLFDQAVGDRNSAMGAIASSTHGFYGIGGFDVGANAAAAAEVQSAQADVNQSAVGSSARVSAMARLREAQTKLADSPASVGDWVARRIAKIRRWKTAISKLASVWGGSPAGQQLLRDVYDKGPDGGTELAEQLAANPVQLQDLMNLYNEGTSLDQQLGAYQPDVIDANARINLAAGQIASEQTIILQLDGEIVYQTLLKKKARQGGRSLNL